MSGPTTGWRPAARLARREAIRRPWRTLLVIALIGLPVAALTGALVVGRAALPSPDNAQRARFGAADVIVHVAMPYDEDRPGRLPTPEGARATATRLLPATTAQAVYRTGPEGIRTADGIVTITAIAGDHADPTVVDIRPLASGRYPASDGEIAPSVRVAQRSGLRVGDSVELVRGGTAIVVGTVWVQDPDGDTAVILTDSAPTIVHEGDRYDVYVTTDGPPASFGGANGVWVEGPFDLAGARAEQRGLLTAAYVIAGLALLATAIIASSAFAVGARRQLRTLGLLASNGASPTQVRMAVLFQGTVAGIVGSVGGVALGIGAAAVLVSRLDELLGRAFPALALRPADLAVALALGVVAATGAALIPAVTASRVPTLAALAGRRPQGRVPGSVPIRGLVVAAVGIGGLAMWRDTPDPRWTTGLGLAVIATFGTIAICPWLIGLLEGLSGRTSGGLRLAARGLSRNRLRSGAVVAAILAPTALATFGVTTLSTLDYDRSYDNGLADDQVILTSQAVDGADDFLFDAAIERARTALGPDAVVADVAVVSLAIPDPSMNPQDSPVQQPMYVQVGQRGGLIGVATPDLLDALRVSDRTRAAVADGRAVIFTDSLRADTNDTAIVSGITDSISGWGVDPPSEAALSRALDETLAGAVEIDRTGGDHLVALIPPGVLPEPFTVARVGALARADATIDQATVNLLVDAIYDVDNDAVTEAYLLGRPQPHTPVGLETGFVANGGDGIRLRTVAVLAVLALSLGVVAVTLALTAAEEREERAVLVAVGAPPALRRSTAAWQAALLPLLAAALAVPLGVLAADAVLRQPIDLPIASLVGFLVVVPLGSGLVARAVAGLTGRSRRSTTPLLAQ